MIGADYINALLIAVAVAVGSTIAFRFRKPRPGEAPAPWWTGLATGVAAGIVYAALKYFF